MPPLSRRALASGLLAFSAVPSPLPASQRGLLVRRQELLLPPAATFGVQIYDDDTAERLTLRALKAGFRSFFTSPEGGNQLGFARAIARSGVPRDELYIAGTVLSDVAVGERAARLETVRACEDSRQILAAGGVAALDMLLLERPGRGCGSISGQWRGLREARSAGWARTLGVCVLFLLQVRAAEHDAHERAAPKGLRMRASTTTRMAAAAPSLPHAAAPRVQRPSASSRWFPP